MATFADGLVAYYPCGSPYDKWDRFDASFNNVTPDFLGPISRSWEYGSSTATATLAVEIPNSSGVYTISLWFRQLLPNFRTAIADAGGGNDTPIRINAAGNNIGIRQGGVFYGTGYNPSGFVGSTSWNHLVVTSDGTGNVEFYINGASVGTATAPAPLTCLLYTSPRPRD